VRAAALAGPVAAFGLALIAAGGGATAEPCEDHVDDPIALPWREAGVDAPRGGCLRSEVSVDLLGHALIDEPAFYGTLGGGASVMARFGGQYVEYGLGVRLLDATFVQNAVLKVTETGYGPITAQVALGDQGPVAGRPAAYVVYARVEVPFTRAELAMSSGGIQLGGALTWQIGAHHRLHGRVGLLGAYASSAAGSETRGAGVASVDLSSTLLSWLVATGGVDVQGGWFGAGLDHVAARAGAHWRITGVWRAAVAAGVPLVGAERTDVAFTLGVRRDLD
jgi:hypothetical protein